MIRHAREFIGDPRKFIRHPREGGDPTVGRFTSIEGRGAADGWIPAFAGMTILMLARTPRANGFKRYQTPANVACFSLRDQPLERFEPSIRTDGGKQIAASHKV